MSPRTRRTRSASDETTITAGETPAKNSSSADPLDPPVEGGVGSSPTLPTKSTSFENEGVVNTSGGETSAAQTPTLAERAPVE